MPIDTVIHTNQQSIDRVLKTGAPLLLLFWRKDSPPSLTLDPALEELASRFAGKALVAKVDAASEVEMVRRFNIRQLPTLLFFKQGVLVATVVGAAPASAVGDWLTYLVSGGAKPALPSGPALPLTDAGPTSREADLRQPQTEGTPLTLTDANFAQVIGQPGPVLVDFWAAWCGPCRMVAPVVDQLAREFNGRAVVGKLNVDEQPRTAQQYNVMSIPTLFVFKQGQIVDRIVGAQPAQVIRQKLMQHI